MATGTDEAEALIASEWRAACERERARADRFEAMAAYATEIFARLGAKLNTLQSTGALSTEGAKLVSAEMIALVAVTMPATGVEELLDLQLFVTFRGNETVMREAKQRTQAAFDLFASKYVPTHKRPAQPTTTKKEI